MSVVHEGFPLPDLAWEPGRRFWEAAARRELSLPKCVQCGRFNWYPQPACRFCGSTEFDWPLLSGEGRVFSYAVVARPFLPAFTELVPFVTALVTIAEDERVRLATRLVGLSGPEDAPAVEMGMLVKVSYVPLHFSGVSGHALAPLFEPFEPGGAS
jgi:hypothetical protein